jgi:hypothetical protein
MQYIHLITGGHERSYILDFQCITFNRTYNRSQRLRCSVIWKLLTLTAQQRIKTWSLLSHVFRYLGLLIAKTDIEKDSIYSAGQSRHRNILGNFNIFI